jgi:hypothetical protein
MRRKHGMHKPSTAAFASLVKAREVLQRTYGGTGAAAVAHGQRAMGATIVFGSTLGAAPQAPGVSDLFLGSPAPGSS